MHQVARNESETRREAQIEAASERVGTGTGTRTRRLSQVRVKTSQVVVYVALAMTVVALVAVSMWPQSTDHRRSVADQSLPEADATVGDAASRLPATGLGIRWRQSDERWQWSSQDAVAIVDGALQAEGGYVTSRSDQVSRVLAAWSGTDAATVVVELTSTRPRAAAPEPLLTVQQNDGSPVLSLLRLDDRLEVRLATNDVSLPPQIFLSPAAFIDDTSVDLAVTISDSEVTLFTNGSQRARFPRQGDFGALDDGFIAIAGHPVDSGRFHGRVGRIGIFDYALSAEQIAEY